MDRNPSLDYLPKMTEPLSPAAQAVLDAFLDSPVDAGNYYATRIRQIAAVLRAAAVYCKQDRIQLLAVADELEGQ